VKAFAKQLAIVFGLWTLVALSTGLADYAYWLAIGGSPSLVQVFRRPLTEQWIWAALTPVVFHLAGRFPLARPHLPRAFALHLVFFVLLSMLHCVVADALGGPLISVPAHYSGSLLVLRFLQEFYSDIWMYWPLVGIRALMDSHAREQARAQQAHQLEQSLSGLRLSLLRAQIQPHFLFNTLHAISALLRVDPRAAEDMVADFADILRASMTDAGAQEIPLGRELELARCYLRIQQRRLGDRLSVDVRVEPQAAQAAVPALVLQSLVENAVVHGIAPMNRPGRLELHARRDGDQLVVQVNDNGAGLPAQQHAGVGLANARERLVQLYGSAQSFELASAADRGTAVTLRIPYRVCEGGADPVLTDHENSHPDRGRRTARAAQPVVTAGT